jgi:hypothetical protein
MLKRYKILRWLLLTVLLIGVLYLILLFSFRPSHNRDWELGHEALPQIIYDQASSQVTIENYRNFNWTTAKSAEANYETRTFDLNEMTGVDVLISHFDDFEGLAHIFLSFGFAGGEQVVVSLETRREVGEEFSPVLGLLRQFEIIYVVGSEEDVVGVRTGHRNERVYLYPTKATAEQARKLFDLLAADINGIYQKPKMYNTLTNNCTNSLTRPVEVMSDVRFPLTWKTILPGYFDEVLYEMDLIQSELSFAEIKAMHLIDNNKVDVNAPNYSFNLRQSIAIPN